MIVNLIKYRAKFERFRHCLTDLQSDIADRQNKQRIFYAVDFSELYSYINQYGDANIHSLGVGLDDSDQETSFRQHRLALEHLFNSFSDKLFLLPPYLAEVWGYGKNNQELENHYRNNLAGAQEFLTALDETELEFLQNLPSTAELSPVQKEKLLQIVKDDFETICDEATGFLAWQQQAFSLRSLFKENKVSSALEEILGSEESSLLMEPTVREESQVFTCFPREVIKRKFYQKLIDARAIVYLEKINRLLAPRSEKLLLVTRDSSMRDALVTLDSQKDYNSLKLSDFLRDPETIFFDLILLGTSPDKKLDWLNDSVNELRKIEDQLVKMINPDESPMDRKSIDYRIAESNETILQTTFKRWDERINLQLSLASREINWLNDAVFSSAAHYSDQSNEAARKLASVRNLFVFIKQNQEFETDAVSEVEKIWQDIIFDTLRIQFLRLFKTTNLEPIGEILASKLFTTQGGGVLLPPSSSLMPYIEFTSLIYDERLAAFRHNASRSDHSTADVKALVVEVTTGIAEPEDFLFMAFILGILEFWQESLQTIEEVWKFPPEIFTKFSFDQAQAYYFRGFVKRKLGENENDLIKEMNYYDAAAKDLLEALSFGSNDPRYLKEYGAIALFYEEARRDLKRTNMTLYNETETGDKPSEINLEKAREYLRKAWEIQKDRNRRPDDTRLKIEILNNIIYTEVLQDAPDLEMAEKMLVLLKAERLKIKSSEPLIARSVDTFIRDTEIMLQAKKHFLRVEHSKLSKKLEELENLPNEIQLNAYRLRANAEHQRLLREWLARLANTL